MRDIRALREARLRDSVPNQLGKLFRVMARVYNRALKPFDISSVQAHILATLWMGGPMTVGELQQILMLGSSTLSGALDRMEARGLLSRKTDPRDRRAFVLTPVDWPARKREALLDTLIATEDECFGGLNASERRELGRLLSKATRAVADVEDDGG